MRRTELLILDVMRMTKSEAIDTSGTNKDIYVQFLQEGQDKLQSYICSMFPHTFLNESLINLVVGQEIYTLPEDLYMGTRLASVEFLFNQGVAGSYIRIPPARFKDRVSYFSSNVPLYYIRRNNTLLMNPIPRQAVTGGLRIVYQKQLRRLDIRRGKISSVAMTGSTINSITLNISPTLVKDSPTIAAAIDILNLQDYICIVDRDGNSILDNIPIDSYNSTTGVITVSSGFTTTLSSGAFTSQYITSGKLSTTHSQLSDMCERYLVSYCASKIFTIRGCMAEGQVFDSEVKKLEDDILESYSQPDEDIYYPVLNPDWST